MNKHTSLFDQTVSADVLYDCHHDDMLSVDTVTNRPVREKREKI